ncbi:MAG: LD-carboxypeptidase [Chlorobiota bacterium]
MGWTRREWLRVVGTLPLGVSSLRQVPSPAEPPPLLCPRGLRPGAVVAITAPASPAHPSEMGSAVKALQQLGCRVTFGTTVQRRGRRYLAASDEERARELQELVANPQVDAILCARGGYGTMRLLPLLDWELFRQHPKPIIGFSDITALLLAIATKARIVTYHGPVAVSEFDAFTLEYFRRTLYLPEAALQPWSLRNPSWEVLSPGVACGPLIGGNLTLLVSLLGTPYEPDLRGAVLFLEDVGEEPYRIDRMLTQLLLADKLQQCVAVLIGNFRTSTKRTRGDVSWQPTVAEILREKLAPLRIPILAGIPLGHIRSKLTLPLGVWAEVNTHTHTICLAEPSVANNVA